ncbi:hypothetical protein COW46_00865 [Candidatus Gracilibacteria bacterium CG17_big_fil_post_rev_8_21_14_2_50_48_13]|nr:MAG: hypothetical protein COW46_00865 [Candidatus Gracilibacteria bacterium CG17_big_fil_post_rev_8_21_14_2_50_48_13]
MKTTKMQVQPVDFTKEDAPATPARASRSAALTPAQRVQAGEKISFEELEELRKSGRSDLWIRHELLHGQKEVVTIPLDMGEGFDKVDQRTGEVLYPMEFVAINGITAHVPKGVPVAVSYLIAQQLKPYINSKIPRKHIPMNVSKPQVSYSF